MTYLVYGVLTIVGLVLAWMLIKDSNGDMSAKEQAALKENTVISIDWSDGFVLSIKKEA
jgi:hypothetical protein